MLIWQILLPGFFYVAGFDAGFSGKQFRVAKITV